MATNEAKPNGYLEILPGKETDFLWPLAVEKIPMVGKQTEHQLKTMGIHTIGQLAATPPEMLEQAFGKWGESLWKKANGLYYSPVEPYSEQKSISRENTFDADTADLNFLNNELVRLTEKAAYDLRTDQKLTGCVTVKVKYADFDIATKQEMISYTALDDVLLAKAKSVFQKLYRGDRKIRLLGVRFSQLIPMTLQMNLFDNTGEKLHLYQTIDAIKNQFGSKAVTKATVLKKGDS
jgi:DNA polymerase-4